MIENDHPTTPIVDAIEKINFAGNITPRSWYSCPLLKYPSGKTHLAAITLLADICYWYRPTEVVDERTGRIISRRRKFKLHRLEKKYPEWSAEFGLTDREARDAVALLVKVGLIIREVWRPENRIFLEPIPDAITAITFPDGSRVTSEREPGHAETGAETLSDVSRPTLKRERTNTESTAESTSKNTASKAKAVAPAAELNNSVSAEQIEADTQSLINLRLNPSAAKKLAAQYSDRIAVVAAYWSARGFDGFQKPAGAVRDSIEHPEKWPEIYQAPPNGSTPAKPAAPRPTPAQARKKHAGAYEAVWSAMKPSERETVEREKKDRFEYIETHYKNELALEIRQRPLS